MSELRSVIAFFLGLVFFIVLIGFAIGRIRLPQRNPNETATAVTPTVVATVTPTRGPGLLDRIAGIFRRNTPTPSPRPTDVPRATETPVDDMKEALDPEQITGGTVIVNKGGEVVTIDKTGTQSIPDTGAPTLLIPFSLLLGGVGLKLRKRG